MYKFLGLNPPPAKKNKTLEERRDVQKSYDAEKRKRTFQTSWKAQYPWLIYNFNDDTGNGCMTCNICIEYEKTGTFVTGCTNFRLETIRIHQNSEGHIMNTNKCKAKSVEKLDNTQTQSEAKRAVLMMNRAAFTKMTFLFRNAHYIAKSNRPYSDFVQLCLLDKAKGIDIGDTYITDKSCQKFVSSVAMARQQEQDDIVKEGSFLSIISDGSTDVSSKEAEIVYVRTSVRCQVSTLFIGVKNVPKADGENISKAISNLMTERFQETWKEKLVAMGTDGASVMIELAYKDAIKGTKIWQRCDALMLNIYLFYKYSPLNRANLKASFESLNMKMLLPTRVGGTRWVPHHERALKNVLHGHAAIVRHLEQMQAPGEARKDSSAKARNFLKALKDKHSLFWLHFMLDVVQSLSTVSRTVQSKDSNLGDVYNEIEACKAIMGKYMNSDGPNVRKYMNASDSDGEKIMHSTRNTFLNSLIQAISTRFEGDLHLFKGCTVLSFPKWPRSLEQDIEFGDSHIVELVEVSRPALELSSVTVDPDAIESEWTRFKTELYNTSSKSIQTMTWTAAADAYMSTYPNLFMLIDYLLTLPSSSVDAERGFSSMKVIKNDWRSRLGCQNLSDLILVSLETPSVDKYDPTAAINAWNTGGVRTRRPFYKDDLKKNTTVDNIVLIEEAEVPEFEMADEDQNDILIEPDVYMCAEKLDNGDEEQDEEDEDELYYSNRDITSLQMKSYRLFLDLMQ
ncbi:Hypothetical predicted protein [Mytilus galloprovincialis]|uniref:TTF-type domain-containing protein n=1 Tax=Mytilus galloprovincialis TaxID=29158 RepID=A0A8B6BSW5_MYTGA|nr:Hypothetical predicted protein [Mytilus galloprovincialis]